MAKSDYEQAAAEAIGMPHPDRLPAETTAADFLPVGEWSIADQEATVAAISTKRAAKVRRLAAALATEGLTRQAEEAAAHDFLTYAEYRRTVPRVDDIRAQLAKIEEGQKRQEFDRTHKPDKPIFYTTHEPPTKNETTFVGLFNPNTHKPDVVGYLAYIKAVAPSLFDLFFLRLPAWLPEDLRKRHTYLVGGSGSGKSEFMKVEVHSDMRKAQPPCVVVLDPHGKFADEVARQREVVKSGRLVYINPALSKHRTPTLNPFELDNPEDAPIVARQIVGVFDLLFQQEKNAAITGNMGVILTPCVTALLRMPGSDILTLQKLLGEDEDSPFLRKAMAHMEPQQRDFIRAEWSKTRYDSTKNSLIAKIQSLASKDFLNFVCGKSTIRIDELVERRSVICLSMQKGEVIPEAIPAIGAFFLAMLQGYAYRKFKQRQHAMIPINVYIDECHNFLSPTVGEILEEGRKFGLHLTLAQQRVGQHMDASLKGAVLANTAIKITGYNSEPATQREMARVMEIDENELTKLKAGQFFVKAGNAKTFKLYTPLLTGSAIYVSSETWHAVIGEQLNRYYRPIEPPKRAGQGNPAPDAKGAPEATAEAVPSDFLTPPVPDLR